MLIGFGTGNSNSSPMYEMCRARAKPSPAATASALPEEVAMCSRYSGSGRSSVAPKYEYVSQVVRYQAEMVKEMHPYSRRPAAPGRR